MRSLYIASTEGSGGKTTISVGLCLALRAPRPQRRLLQAGRHAASEARRRAARRGRRASSPRCCGSTTPLTDVCPVVLDEDALHEVLAGSEVDAMDARGKRLRARARGQATSSSARVSARSGRAGFCAPAGPRSWPGSTSGDHRWSRSSPAPACSTTSCYVKDALKQHLLGVLFNMVPESRLSLVQRRVRALPRKSRRRDLRRAAGQRAALRRVASPRSSQALGGDLHLRRGARRAPGRDLPDRRDEPRARPALLPAHAATRSSSSAATAPRSSSRRSTRRPWPSCSPATTCPARRCSSAPRSAACRIVSVATDTVTATDGIRRLFGRLGVQGQRKIELIAEQIEQHVDLDRLVADLQAIDRARGASVPHAPTTSTAAMRAPEAGAVVVRVAVDAARRRQRPRGRRRGRARGRRRPRCRSCSSAPEAALRALAAGRHGTSSSRRATRPDRHRLRRARRQAVRAKTGVVASSSAVKLVARRAGRRLRVDAATPAPSWPPACCTCAASRASCGRRICTHAAGRARAGRRSSTPAPTPRCRPERCASSPSWARSSPRRCWASTGPASACCRIGEEPSKGTPAVIEAHKLIAADDRRSTSTATSRGATS